MSGAAVASLLERRRHCCRYDAGHNRLQRRHCALSVGLTKRNESHAGRDQVGGTGMEIILPAPAAGKCRGRPPRPPPRRAAPRCRRRGGRQARQGRDGARWRGWWIGRRGPAFQSRAPSPRCRAKRRPDRQSRPVAPRHRRAPRAKPRSAEPHRRGPNHLRVRWRHRRCARRGRRPAPPPPHTRCRDCSCRRPPDRRATATSAAGRARPQ